MIAQVVSHCTVQPGSVFTSLGQEEALAVMRTIWIGLHRWSLTAVRRAPVWPGGALQEGRGPGCKQLGNRYYL